MRDEEDEYLRSEVESERHPSSLKHSHHISPSSLRSLRLCGEFHL